MVQVKPRSRTRHNFGLYLSHAVLILASLSILLPILWVLRTSVANRLIAYKIPPVWIFTPTLDNYRVIFEQYPVQQYFLNSLIVSAVASLIALVIGSLAGYSIARFRTGDPVLRLSMLSTQMLPAIALVIPIFVLARLFHLWHSRTGLIIAYLSFNLPYTICILIGFFQTIPLDLEEAAMIDGADANQVFWKIVMPLAIPQLSLPASTDFRRPAAALRMRTASPQSRIRRTRVYSPGFIASRRSSGRKASHRFRAPHRSHAHPSGVFALPLRCNASPRHAQRLL